MKKLQSLIFLCLLFPCIAAISQDNTTTSATPSSDAEYISLLKEYTLKPDGSMEYRYKKEQKLNTYRAFHNLYGETFVIYNPSFQKFTVNSCFTVMADGLKVVAPANAFNEVLPASAANAPPFNVLREMVITHTALERGAVENLDYTLSTAKDNAPALMGNEVLAENEPVKDLTLTVRIPEGSQLFYKLTGGAGEPGKSSENGFQIFTWHVQNVNAISPEDFQKGNNEAYPRVLFSSSGSRNAVFGYLTKQPAFELKCSDAMKADILALQKENPDQLSLALKIQEKVINDIHLWPVSIRYTGYKLRTAEESWNSMGASLPEKAILLAALLEAAGLEADPVAVSRDAFFDEKLGTLADIEDFAVRIELKDAGVQYLSLWSANPADLAKALSGRVFTALGKGENPEIQKSSAAKLSVNMSGNFITSSDPKITGELSLILGGAVNPYLGLIRDKNKMKGMVGGEFSKPDLKEIKVSQSSPETSFQTYTVMDEKPFRKDSSWLHFSIPYCSAGIESWGMKTLSAKRTQPLELPCSGEENYEYTLSLPDGWKLYTDPSKIELSNKAGHYLFELKQEGAKLVISRKIRFSENVISVENYADFKSLMDNWNNPRQREVIIKL